MTRLFLTHDISQLLPPTTFYPVLRAFAGFFVWLCPTELCTLSQVSHKRAEQCLLSEQHLVNLRLTNLIYVLSQSDRTHCYLSSVTVNPPGQTPALLPVVYYLAERQPRILLLWQ